PADAFDVGQGSNHEILEGGVALVEAPPEPAGQSAHLLGCGLPEPLPGESALAHASDRHEDQHTRRVDLRALVDYPVGQQVELGLATDEVLGLKERIG